LPSSDPASGSRAERGLLSTTPRGGADAPLCTHSRRLAARAAPPPARARRPWYAAAALPRHGVEPFQHGRPGPREPGAPPPEGGLRRVGARAARRGPLAAALPDPAGALRLDLRGLRPPRRAGRRLARAPA